MPLSTEIAPDATEISRGIYVSNETEPR